MIHLMQLEMQDGPWVDLVTTLFLPAAVLAIMAISFGDWARRRKGDNGSRR